MGYLLTEKYPKLFISSPTVYKYQFCMNGFVTFHLVYPTPMIPIASSYTVQMKWREKYNERSEMILAVFYSEYDQKNHPIRWAVL